MSTLTFDIATILQDNGFGTIGMDIFVSQDVPPKPDEVLNITSIGNFSPSFPTLNLEYPLVQVIARGSKGGQQACEERISNVNRFLNRISDYYVNESKFIFINHQSGPSDLGLDVTMRPMYSVTAVCLWTWPFQLLVGNSNILTFSTSILSIKIPLSSTVSSTTFCQSDISEANGLAAELSNNNYCQSDLNVT